MKDKKKAPQKQKKGEPSPQYYGDGSLCMQHLTADTCYLAIMEYKVPSQTRIGHVHLKVSDLDKALSFYQDLLGFEITQR